MYLFNLNSNEKTGGTKMSAKIFEKKTHKHCPDCDQTLPISAFDVGEQYEDFLSDACLGCTNFRNMQEKILTAVLDLKTNESITIKKLEGFNLRITRRK
jgi:hypothetical protein